MTRHSKNCTANSVYSYHEKQKDGRISGFGSLKQRFAKDAVKDFDCCCLTLHPCREPLLTTDGYLYDKEAVLEYILSKKKENSRKLREYERQCKQEKNEIEEIGKAEQRSKLEKFLKTEASVSSASQAAQISSNDGVQASSSISNMSKTQAKNLPCFWIPALTPGNKEIKKAKPESKILCPMSGKQIRFKDLIPVKFTRVDENKSLESTSQRYKCPVTGDLLGNNVPCALIKTTGDVVTMECVELIKKDLIHPLNNTKISENDIIPLQRGGTGFSKVNEALVAKRARPVLQV